MKLELQNMGLSLDKLAPTAPAKRAKEAPTDAFTKALDKADAVASDADKAGQDVMTGKIEIHQAMVRMEKADLMLKLGATVRSKVIDAYQQLLSSAGG